MSGASHVSIKGSPSETEDSSFMETEGWTPNFGNLLKKVGSRIKTGIKKGVQTARRVASKIKTGVKTGVKDVEGLFARRRGAKSGDKGRRRRGAKSGDKGRLIRLGLGLRRC